MLKSLPKILIIFFLVIFIFQLACLLFLALTPGISQAADIQFTPQVQVSDYTFDSSDKSTGNIARYVRAIYKYAIGIVGILAAVILMIGGVMWIVAGGSATAIGEAKSWIGASLTGLVIALASYLILATINPALVNFKTTGIKTVEESKIGRCLTPALPGPYICEDNFTEEQCTKNNPGSKWQSGAICPTPCCTWEQHITATTLCKLQGGCQASLLYVNCDDTQKNLTVTECNNKPGLLHSFMENGKCNKITLIGTTNTLTSYQCINK